MRTRTALENRAHITRRTWLRSALGVGIAAAAHSLQARQQMQTHMPPGVPARPKGPLVFLDYDQQELDAAYDQAPWAPNQADIARRVAQRNSATLGRLGPPKRLSYGPTTVEQLDVYLTRQPNAPVHVYVHGGAWREGVASASAYLSEMFVDHGSHFVAFDFNNVVETKGDLMTMARQVRRGVAWVYENARAFGGDPNRIYISGFSSGGHLAAVAATTDWARDFKLPPGIVKGALFCSGLYDLQPVSLSARRTYVNFTPETIEQLSPERHIARLTAPVVVAHGTLETPEFQRQNRRFAAAVKAAGKPVTFLIGEGYNHFEMIETLASPYGLLGRAALQQMNLTRP
jgi:arylformamidase